MVTFEIVSDREVTINGVGLLEPGTPKVVDAVMEAVFAAEHGYPLTQAKFPPYVKVTTVVSDKTEEVK